MNSDQKPEQQKTIFGDSRPVKTERTNPKETKETLFDVAGDPYIEDTGENLLF